MEIELRDGFYYKCAMTNPGHRFGFEETPGAAYRFNAA
jgi:hypothetical protein